MKFKVGDKVRFTREAISYKLKESMTIKYSIVLGSTVDEVSADNMYLVNYIWYSEEDLELVPEEPEFEYGEEIEVTNDGDNWLKRIFITKSKECRYVCVDHTCYSSFKNGRQYTVAFYDSARKSIPQLTRKEIANRFGVSENFILIDDVNANEV